MAETLKKVLEHLRDTINSHTDGSSSVEIANIAALNDGDEFLESTFPVVLSIVNIEEETTARNPNRFIKKEDHSLEKFAQPAQYLNIFVLFTAYSREQKQVNYLEGINKLERVISYFQQERIFFVEGNKVIMDLESMKFSELNQLWSMLGNRYMPSVLYKLRLLKIQTETEDGGRPIEEIKIKLYDDKDDKKAVFLEDQVIKT